MLDHIGFPVTDAAMSRAFYVAALAPLGFSVQKEFGTGAPGGEAHIGFGSPGRPQFWIGSGGSTGSRLHVAFVADSRERVDAFYQAALAAGGRDNGAPGIRAHYHPDYYGAFVLDPDGHNVEAVCHLPG